MRNCVFDLMLNIPINNLSVTSGRVFLGLTSMLGFHEELYISELLIV